MASKQKLKFTPDHLKLLSDQFNMVDSDGDKLIDENEFRKLFRSLGQTVSNKRLDHIVSESFKDLNESKGMDFETFVNSFLTFYSPPPTVKTLTEAFRMFEDGSGYLDKGRLFTLLSTRGEKLTKSELEEFSQMMNLKNGSSKVDYKELAENMHSVVSQVPTPN